MRSRRLLTRQAVLVSGMLLTAGACSFIYDLDKVQCEVPDDCAGFDEPSAQKGLACVEGVCTYLYPVTTTTGSPTSTTGSAGAGGTPECTENDDCIEKLGNPAICRNDECIELYSDECPIVLGEGTNFANLKSPKEPFIFGAYAGIGDPIPENTAATANYEYAIDQVNGKDGGYLYAGARRPFVAVVCNDDGNIADSMNHLVKTLEVPGIISTLGSAALLDAFENEEYGARPNNVFVLSTTFADSTFTNPEVDPNELLWHMLGDGEDQGAAYKPLVAQTEAYVRAQRSIPEEQPIRIVMVVSDDPYIEDVARVITNTVQFNGKSVIANADDDCGDGEPCFVRVDIDSATAENPMPDVSKAYNAIITLEPQIVLAITFSEFLQEGLLPSVETVWDLSKAARELPPPFYLFSPRIPRNATRALVQQLETPPEGMPDNPAFLPLRQRILGVAPSGAEDTTLYDAYLYDFKREYSHLLETVTLDGTENFYDAAFFMMYSIHGGVKTTNLTGRDVSSGMSRLLGGGTDWNVGPDHVEDIIEELRLGDQDRYITLNGTMGPPDFRPSGARINLPSIYCYDLDPDGTDNAMKFYQDVLRYDPDDESLSSPTGEDPCSIDGFLGEP